MRFSILFATAATLALASAQHKGFNYGSTNTDGSAKTLQRFTDEFNTTKTLVGTSGFSSARLYTTIQAGTTNTPISAIQAAINTKTTLLLGLWASAGQTNIDNEITALRAAISQYGTAFTDLIAGISVGSEDLYRISPTGVINKSGAGASPSDLVNYIGQVRSALSAAKISKPVGHVDTWTAWVNGSNSAVIQACDWLGMDAYPYYQNTQENSISNAANLLFRAYDATASTGAGKPVWVTETGWPVSGPTENQAVPSLDNAKAYWRSVGCAGLFGKLNTWWFTLQDAYPTTPSPSFGIVGTKLSTNPLYDLTCPAIYTFTFKSMSTTSPSASSCPASLASTYELPHLILPISKTSPETAYGTSYKGKFTSDISTIFDFDLTTSYSGESCSLIFLLPPQSTISYIISGSGGSDVFELSSPVEEGVTFNTIPSKTNFGSAKSVMPGNNCVVTSHECAAMEFVATRDLSPDYFEDSGNGGIGVSISVC